MVRIAPTIEPGAFAREGSQKVAAPSREGVGGFHPGEVVKVELVKQVGADEGLFRIAGRFFRALYPSGLTPGVAVPMRVIDTGPPLVLRLPDALGEMISQLAHPAEISFAEAANSLTKLLQPGTTTGEARALLENLRQTLDLPADPKELAAALVRYFRQSGIFHEALLARGQDPGDVKSLALRLLALLGEDEKAAPLLKALISHVETYQARSLAGEHPVFPFLLNWGEEPIKGEIELLEEGKASGTGKGGGLLIRLDMPNLGHVETALWWYSGGVSVTMRVPKALEEWFGERIGDLEAKLREVEGLGLTTLRVEVKAPAGPALGRSLLEITV